MWRATSVGRSCSKSRLEGETRRAGGRTNSDDIELEERDDLLLDAEESRPWKGSQQSLDEIFEC
jgi:hypothetical protein